MRVTCGPDRSETMTGSQTTKAPTDVSAGQGLVVAVSTSAPEGIRTPNLLIRSQMLYPLSYGRMLPGRGRATSTEDTRPGAWD